MAASMIQLIGFMLSALGVFLISAATAMDMWSLQDRSFTIVTNVYTYSGLWNSCVGTSYGTTQCRPYFTILGLPGKRITPGEEKKGHVYRLFLHMLDQGEHFPKGPWKVLQNIWEVLGADVLPFPPPPPPPPHEENAVDCKKRWCLSGIKWKFDETSKAQLSKHKLYQSVTQCKVHFHTLYLRAECSVEHIVYKVLKA